MKPAESTSNNTSIDKLRHSEQWIPKWGTKYKQKRLINLIKLKSKYHNPIPCGQTR